MEATNKHTILLIGYIASIMLLLSGCEKEFCWVCDTISTQHNYEESVRKEVYCGMTESQIEAIKIAGYRLPEYRVECFIRGSE